MIVYPTENYNSFINFRDADRYFRNRLNTTAWDTGDQITALLQSFRSLQTLNVVINLSDDDSLQALKDAQCEQALWELKNDLEELQASSVSLGGMISVKLNTTDEKPDRYSPRALAILRPYLRCATISRTR
jgi:hypothetical protein